MFSIAQPFRPARAPEAPPTPTDFAASLAQWLGGDRPQSTLQVSGGISSGKATFAFHLCLAALRDGRAIGWVDSGQGFHPLAALEAGEPLSRLLVVRVPDGAEALRAADLLLSCPGAVAVAVVALPPRYRPPEASLLRLQRLAERSGSHLLLLDEHPERSTSLGSPVALRLSVQRDSAPVPTWASRLEVTRHKGGHLGPLGKELRHEPDRLRLHRTL